MDNITDVLWKKAGANRIPLTGAFELLPVCNLDCKMCYVRLNMDEVNKQGGLLPEEEWIEYASQARDAGLLYPLLTGGEPLLHPGFYRIFNAMEKMGLQISVNSNGTLINESVSKWFGAHVPTRINITLYGASEDTYQKHCGDGTAYGKVKNAVQFLRKYNVPFKFNVSITPENVDDLEDMMKYAKSVNAPIRVATYMFPPLRRDEGMVGKNHRLSPREAALARVKADWLQSDEHWFVGQAKRFEKFVPLTEEKLVGLGESREMGMTCRAGRSSFWLNWKGELGNCGMYTTHSVSLKGRKFKEVWEEVVKDTDEVRHLAFCNKCPNYHLCHACIAMVHNECGNTNGRPIYLCEMNQASAEIYKEFVETKLKTNNKC